jgi:YVTN family beta-propeller protein
MPTSRPARQRLYAILTIMGSGLVAACGPAAAQSGAAHPGGGIPAGTLVVANQQSANASIIELPSGDTTLVHVGTGPHEAAITADGRFAVVTVYGTQVPGNQLAVIDLDTKRVARTIDLGEFRRPHGVVALPDAADLVTVTSEAARHLLVVNIATGEIESAIPTEARGSHMVAVTADGRRGFTANIPDGSVTELALDRATHVRVSPVATMTEGIAVTPDGAEVWVGSNDAGTVSVLDTRTNEVVATIPGFQMPYRLGISPDGRLAVVCDPAGNAIHVVDVASRRVLGAVTGLGSPRGVFIAPDSRTAFVTINAESQVAVVDLESRRVLARYPVGASPDGVAFRGR